VWGFFIDSAGIHSRAGDEATPAVRLPEAADKSADPPFSQ